MRKIIITYLIVCASVVGFCSFLAVSIISNQSSKLVKYGPVSYEQLEGEYKDSYEVELFEGTLSKENIKELDIVSEYMYVLNFTEPYLLEVNSTGQGPVYVDRLDIYGQTSQEMTLEENTGKNILIEGFLDWGYSESRVIRPISVYTVK